MGQQGLPGPTSGSAGLSGTQHGQEVGQQGSAGLSMAKKCVSRAQRRSLGLVGLTRAQGRSKDIIVTPIFAKICFKIRPTKYPFVPEAYDGQFSEFPIKMHVKYLKTNNGLLTAFQP